MDDARPAAPTPALPQFREVPHGSADYAACVRLRDLLLRAPLGLAFSEAELAAEATDYHLAGFSGGNTLVACLVLSPRGDGTAIRMRQVAVASEWQRNGIGTQLVAFAEAFARAKGFRFMSLHARMGVTGFYEPLHYTASGIPFTEVGIPHIAMHKTLE